MWTYNMCGYVQISVVLLYPPCIRILSAIREQTTQKKLKKKTKEKENLEHTLSSKRIILGDNFLS